MSLVLNLIFLFHFMNSWVSTTDIIQGSCTLCRVHIFPYWYLVAALPWPCLPSIVDALFSAWLSPLMMLSTLIRLFPVWFYPNLHFHAYLSLCCSVFHQYCWVFFGGGGYICWSFPLLCVFSSSGPSWIPLLVIFSGIHCFWNLWKVHLPFNLPQYVWIQGLRKSPAAWFSIYVSTLWLFVSVGLGISFSFI